VTAPNGTVAMICVELGCVNEADCPPIMTELTWPRPESGPPGVPKLSPVMVTVWPGAAEDGENDWITGGGITVNEPADTAVPLLFVTEMGPDDAALGTST